jgi:hypothetical protein
MAEKYLGIRKDNKIYASDVTNALDTKVSLTGVVAETITGVKTFSTSPVVPSKSADAVASNTTAIATEAQIVKAITASNTYANSALANKVSLTGSIAETITGVKTFSTSPAVPSKNTAAGNNSTVIATEAQVYNANVWR